MIGVGWQMCSKTSRMRGGPCRQVGVFLAVTHGHKGSRTEASSASNEKDTICGTRCEAPNGYITHRHTVCTSTGDTAAVLDDHVTTRCELTRNTTVSNASGMKHGVAQASEDGPKGARCLDVLSSWLGIID